MISADDPYLDRPVVVLSVTQVRGLEFDSVLVADPRGSWPIHPAGSTISTWRSPGLPSSLGVVYEDDLPEVLSRLHPLDDTDLT